jgi:hypothetical protein
MTRNGKYWVYYLVEEITHAEVPKKLDFYSLGGETLSLQRAFGALLILSWHGPCRNLPLRSDD